MVRIFQRKLLLPRPEGCTVRDRLIGDSGPVQALVAQAPAGAGKTVFLAQWLTARRNAYLYYELDEADRDGQVFGAHLLAGLRRVWPDWQPPAGLEADPAELAVELVTEAAVRPPLDLALDRLESAFGQAYLADFLAALVRYAPPTLTLALGTRAPLPVGVESMRRGVRLVTAAELAFTLPEAGEWLGPAGDWRNCHRATGGLPLALELWRQYGAGWQPALAARALAELPPHISGERGRALVAEWLAGQLSLTAFGHELSCAQPGAEQLWSDLAAMRRTYLQGEFREAQARLRELLERARGRGDRTLTGAVALLMGETYYGLGEYGEAVSWYRQGFDADPALEFTGIHSLPMILRDQGNMAEAFELAARMVEGCTGRSDLAALSYAHLQHAYIAAQMGQFAAADQEMAEAERLGSQSAEPLYGLIALAHRGGIAATKGDYAEFRRLTELAHTAARGRSHWLEAFTGYILSAALLVWGERETAARLAAEAFAELVRLDVKFQVQMLLVIQARWEWLDGHREEARAHFDRALGLAAAEGYIFTLVSEKGALPLIVDALVRGVEVAHCQKALAAIGQRAAEPLLELISAPDAAARRAAIYPLAMIGGERATAAVRSLLHDPEESVRVAALLAVKAMGLPAPADPVAAEAAAAVMAPVEQAGAPAQVSVALLGPLLVKVDGQAVQAWRTTKARDLLGYLILGGERPFARDQLGEALWPDGEPEAVTRLLHTSLHHLRRHLGAGAEGLIAFAGGAYQLNRESVALAVDLERFQHLAAAPDEASWRAAAELYRGDLLEGLDYPWVEAPRARARGLFLDLLRKLAGHLKEAGRPAEAAEYLQLLIQTDQLAEDGHVALMECYGALGNRSAAIQQYRALAKVLDDELGLEPGARAQALYRRLLD